MVTGSAPGDNPPFDTSVAHIARVYDYWLGGKDNYVADRAAGDAALEAYPDLVSRRTLDFSAPVAVMLIAVLHLIGDDESPQAIVARLMDEVPSGSYLALSHVASDIEPEKMAEMRERLNRMVAQKGTYRTHDEVMRFFDGLALVEPRMVRIQQWRPRSETQANSAAAMWGGVGRKP
jgi:S-adenosyl methyltransferase